MFVGHIQENLEDELVQEALRKVCTSDPQLFVECSSTGLGLEKILSTNSERFDESRNTFH